MEGSSSATAEASPAAAPKPNPMSQTATFYDSDGNPLNFDPSINEDERRFYMKAYPTIDLVRERKVHCTICKMHIGTAPAQESIIKMHPVLRVTHCTKCHDFYNSGEFSKGEDGSELYCRWCGQGGEVYCCSNCPYVFCKSCIVKNLSRGVVADIEQNENWSCFSCAPKILWPLRAQHWALVHYIENQKLAIEDMNVPDPEKKQLMLKDRSQCCRLAKAKCGNMSDSMESLDSATSRRSHGSSGSTKRLHKLPMLSPQMQTPAKRPKTSNDEVVCTPDLLSMLEPDCQLTMSHKPRPVQSPVTTSPKVISIQSNYNHAMQTKTNNTPPPLVLRNTGVQIRTPGPTPIVRRTVVGPRQNAPGGGVTPVYHTINGYRIDLNSAAQQETFRLPNGKLIQVKRQGTQSHQNSPNPSGHSSWPQQQQRPSVSIQAHHYPGPRSIQVTPGAAQSSHHVTVQQSAAAAAAIASQPALHMQQQQHQQQQHQQVMRYHNTTVTPLNNHNGPQIQVINGVPTAPAANVPQPPVRAPVMVRHVFPDTAIGQARTQLQEQVFNAMEICQHLTGKVQTLTNSNAYKQARNYLEVKELYIHLSYLLTYAIGRFKGLQDKCLGDMRQLGFVNDADSLENGQLAAGVDYVRYGQLDDVDLFNISSNSFHNQVYEYRKSLLANLKDGEGVKQPLSPLMPLGVSDAERKYDDAKPVKESGWQQDEDDEGEPNESSQANAPYNDTQEFDENDEPEESYFDDEPLDDAADADADADGDADGDADMEADTYASSGGRAAYAHSRRSTEECMSRGEEAIVYDRKLTRLIQQYPSIWCTRHPDYGNFDVTRKQWRTVATHFSRNQNIKLRWKNIRKRFVRIERRIREGKRFNGYFDKATNFLSNRDLPENEWLPVDCGTGDGDLYERRQLDAIERNLHASERREQRYEQTQWDNESLPAGNTGGDHRRRFSIKPIEIRPVDLKIINFVKCNPVLWRKSCDAACNKIDEQTRRSLWMHLWKSMPHMRCDDIMDRWAHLYEMYKTFRLKSIKNERKLANLELKYSKYLAKLYFLYKIDEEELRKEHITFEDFDSDEDYPSSSTKLQDQPDDKEFVLKLVLSVRQYPSLWSMLHVDYYDTVLRDNLWHDIVDELKDFKRDVRSVKLRWQLAKCSFLRYRRERRSLPKDSPLPKYYKQASDDEDNEIEIVEPKTDTITLDSDNEDDGPQASSTATSILAAAMLKTAHTSNVNGASAPSTPTSTVSSSITPFASESKCSGPAEVVDFMTAAQTFLASMLEVDLTEVQQAPTQASSPASSSDSAQKKQPRKKTTNKPNPTLLKQKEMLERERMEEMKRNDLKLKMKCEISLKKAEDEYPFAKTMLEEKEAANAKQASAALQQQLPEQKADNTAEDETNDDDVELLSVVDADSSMEEEEKPGEGLVIKSVESLQQAVSVKADREDETAGLAEKLENKNTDDDGKEAENEEVIENASTDVIKNARTDEPKIVEKAVELAVDDSKEKISTNKTEDGIEEKQNIEKDTEDSKVVTDSEETGSNEEVSSVREAESCKGSPKPSDETNPESEAACIEDKDDKAETVKESIEQAKCEIVELAKTDEISLVAAEKDNSEKQEDSSGFVEDVEMLDATEGNTTPTNAVTEATPTENSASSLENMVKETSNEIIAADKIITTESTLEKTAITSTAIESKSTVETKVTVDAKAIIEPESTAEPKATVELVKPDAVPAQSDPANPAISLTEPDIDVDKEIEKLLQNKSKNECESESATNETATELFKELSDIEVAISPNTSATNADAGAVVAASPDLLADINELIENENAMA